MTRVIELRIVVSVYESEDPPPAKPVRPIYTTTGVELECPKLAKVMPLELELDEAGAA
jgi:hypothetical protein